MMTADFFTFFYEKQCKPLGLRLLRKSLRDAIPTDCCFRGRYTYLPRDAIPTDCRNN